MVVFGAWPCFRHVAETLGLSELMPGHTAGGGAGNRALVRLLPVCLQKPSAVLWSLPEFVVHAVSLLGHLMAGLC
jgi:hypothetical protein